MHNAKALSAQVILKDQEGCHDVFSQFLAQIEAMPEDVRGAQALSFSAHLLEWAAFELARDVSSDEVGDLIQKAAELFEQSSDVAERKLSGFPARSPLLQ